MHLFPILIFIVSILNANSVSWYGDFNKAHKVALAQNKNLMILLIKKECEPCTDSIKTAFINQKYIKKIDENFISVIITKDQKASYPIEMLYTFTYPTLFFLDNKELFLDEPIRGEITPDILKNYLEKYR